MSIKNQVQYPVRYYSHLDTGAPQMTNADGIIKTILKACLVTGYGDKSAAGWTSAYEDAFRIVLRRPLRTGSPPDIKIENGVINGTARNRIVSYAFDSCTGLDDTNSITSVPLLNGEIKMEEWHIIASDFGFVLCVRLANNSNGPRGYTLLCCELPNIDSSKPTVFCVNKHRTTGAMNVPLTYQDIIDLKTGTTVHGTSSSVISSLYFDAPAVVNGECPMSECYVNSGHLLPFFRSPSSDISDINTRIVTAHQRFLYWADVMNGIYNSPRICFIPLDYWVL